MYHSKNEMTSQIDDRLLFVLCSASHAKAHLPYRFRNAYVVPEIMYSGSDEAKVAGFKTDDGSCFYPLSLVSLYRFSIVLVNATRRYSNQMIVVCGGRDPFTSTNTALLLGGYLVLCRDYAPEAVEQVLRPSSFAFIPYDDHLTLIDCWQALAHARQTRPFGPFPAFPFNDTGMAYLYFLIAENIFLHQRVIYVIQNAVISNRYRSYLCTVLISPHPSSTASHQLPPRPNLIAFHSRMTASHSAASICAPAGSHALTGLSATYSQSYHSYVTFYAIDVDRPHPSL